MIASKLASNSSDVEMQPFSMLLLAVMAFFISLTSAAALVSASVTYAHPHGHSSSLTESWKEETKTAWGEWTGKPKSSPSASINNDGTPTTSTIHTTSTETVTAITRRDEEHISHSRGGMGSSWTGETGVSKPSVSFIGTNSWTKTDSGLTTITIAAREEASVDDSCTMVFFKGGGFCLSGSNTKRGDDLMTRSRHHSHHQSGASPANTSFRSGPGHGGKHTSKGTVSAAVTSVLAPTMPTMPGYPAGISASEWSLESRHTLEIVAVRELHPSKQSAGVDESIPKTVDK